MKNKFTPTTIWAFQAAVAICLALLMGHFFHLERSYWAVLTALLLVSQTWGESVKKALERVAMTILGGTIGTLLYFSISHNPHALFLVLILVTFCMVYCIGYSFIGSTFFVTIFVVFLFAIIGNWDVHVLEVRIYETLIGAVTAVATSVFVFPTHSKSNLQTSLKQYIDKVSDVVILSFDIIFNKADKASINQMRDQLYRHFIALSNIYKTSTYEMFFIFAPREKAHLLLNEFAVLMHYTTNLLETSAYINSTNFSELTLERLNTAKCIMLDNLDKTKTLVDKSSSAEIMLPLQLGLSELSEIIMTQLEQQTSQQICAMHSLSFIYYLEKIDEGLLSIEEELRQLKS